jgi:hypothetical protein
MSPRAELAKASMPVDKSIEKNTDRKIKRGIMILIGLRQCLRKASLMAFSFLPIVRVTTLKTTKLIKSPKSRAVAKAIIGKIKFSIS